MNDAPAPDEFVEERPIPSITEDRKKSILPLVFIAIAVLFGAWMVVRGMTPAPAPRPLVPVDAPRPEFSTGITRGNEVPSFTPPTFPQVDVPSAPEQPTTAMTARLLEMQERQRLQLERDQAEMTIRLQAAQGALELRRQENELQLEADRLRQARERQIAPSVVFDVSKAENRPRVRGEVEEEEFYEWEE